MHLSHEAGAPAANFLGRRWFRGMEENLLNRKDEGVKGGSPAFDDEIQGPQREASEQEPSLEATGPMTRQRRALP